MTSLEIGHAPLVERAVAQRRRLGALAVMAGVSLLAGLAVGAGSGSGKGAAGAGNASGADGDGPAAKPAPTLPGGGRRIFPDRRIVALYGNPRDDELGALGIGTPAHAARRLLEQARPYGRKSRPVLPAMELISTTATAAPGPEGLYRDHLAGATIRRYLTAARRAHALLVLDIQPGRGEFGPEITRLRRWLAEPDVGLALDPEWHVGPGEVPGKVIGSTDADVVNAAAAYLSRIVRARNLPQKLLLVHRFTDGMIARDERLRPFPGVATVVNVDGFGSQTVKIAKYKAFVQRTPGVHRGFKLFYKEDLRTMTPAQVMRLAPRPDVVVYE
jgi:hypothetical protein